MAAVQEVKGDAAASTGKDALPKTEKKIIDITTPLGDVLKWDAEGVELIFEHEKGRFMALTATDIAKLHHDNRVRYHMSATLNEKSDPENDEWVRRFKVGEALDRRSEFEKVVHTTSQSARATKKLQAYVGPGYRPYWARTDKIEDRLAQGYEIVKPDKDVYAGVSATDGHFETRVKQGETELVLMRISEDKRAALLKQKQEAANRFDKTGEEAGRSELRALGAKVVEGNEGAGWVDRT